MSKKKKKRGGPPQTWKSVEREVAEFWGSHRNVLSGRNNINDAGERRLGDVVLNDILIEVKLRKSNASIKRAKITRELFDKYKEERRLKNWVHMEREVGTKDIWALVANKELIRMICQFIKSLEGESNAKKEEEGTSS